MTNYLVAIYRPNDYDPSDTEDETMSRDIDVLNEEMEMAGVRFFAGGLQPITTAKSLRGQLNGEVLICNEPYLNTTEHVGGFWILETTDLDQALMWGRKAAIACRAPVEVRPFH